VLAAATVGGLTHLAIVRTNAPVSAGELARAVFAAVPDGVLAAAIGFGFGLLARSMGGGITFGLVFLFVLSGVLSFIPGIKNLSYGQASSDLTSGIANQGETVHGVGIALLIMLVWAIIVVAPGWVAFQRSDLK
jgi:ABC-2 type transport system permease protein